MSKNKQTKAQMTVYDATYNLLRTLGLTTIFGNPGSTDPTISPFFNFRGMNIFSFKTKVLPPNYHGRKYLPTISVGAVLRTNDPFVVRAVKHENATNGDVYLVGTKLFMFGKKFGFMTNAGVR